MTDDGINDENTMDDVELTQEEAMAFRNLEREEEPSRLLEERIVRSLQAEGVLARRGTARWRSPLGGLVAAAAAVVLFAGGAGFGHWMGTRSTTQTLLAVREQDAAQVAQSIQEAGSAYVQALAALSELRLTAGDSVGDAAREASASEVEQGREAAMGSLYAAAFELARLSPGDADVLRILQILAQRRAEGPESGDAARSVVWF